MPASFKRLRPIIVVAAALIALGAYCYYRRPSVLQTFVRPRMVSPVPGRDRFWLRVRHSSPVIAAISVLVVAMVACPDPHLSDALAYGRASAASPISSRGGFRLPEIAVLGVAPQPVPVLSRQIGPPSPDPVLLAAARLALTPTPTPPPAAPPQEARVARGHRDVGVFKVTAYSDSPFLNGTDGRGITRSGVKTHWGCVAVDPRIIPLGTRLVIENYEGTVFTALDTGGGIKGRWIDIWFPTDDEALEHGLKELAIAIVEEE